jgi:hypothetical protein
MIKCLLYSTEEICFSTYSCTDHTSIIQAKRFCKIIYHTTKACRVYRATTATMEKAQEHLHSGENAPVGT